MAVDVSEELVGIDGVVATGVYGTAVAPTDADTALGVTWTDQGVVVAGGVTRTTNRSATVRRGWQQNRKLRTLTTDAAVRFSFTLVQTNQDSVELFHGVEVDTDDGSVVVNPSNDWPNIAFCLDVIDGDRVIREYVPTARVVEVGDQVAVAGDTFGWPVVIESDYNTGLGGHTQRFFSDLAGSAPAPVILSVAAAATEPAGEDDFVKITGTAFGGATAVEFGSGNAALAFTVVDPTLIVASLPAGSAGSVAVKVTTPAGASATKAYTRGV